MTKAGLALVLAISAFAQPGFEVATVKRSPPPEGDRIYIIIGGVRSGRLTFGNALLSDRLRFAYGLASDEQLSGPDWIKSKEVRFDIIAQIPPPVNGAPDEVPPGPSLFTAVQEQLGLKLESLKGPVDVLVVDRANQIPAEN